MNKTLIIYDDIGYIYREISGTYSVPQGGIQYLETEIPEGKMVSKIDTTKTPHEPVYEDIPKSELELLKEKVEDLTQANAELTSIVAMGKTNV
ncbi:hypothetical protein [Clostridium beijerinckii]|uniref:Phage protein n=1 Tax=Clostridium beijerinckii TaxID=1520 RepID=A0AAX0B6L2_CLOBE|nr:hypothetical protein [Clostridium beijerinckii]NRT90083.1 hypothetical protein [Clostridium beijerinckii]NYC69613.1 hypothetical protein [Clostridium beijerinckii]